MTLLERTTALKSRAEALEDLQARIDEAALLQRRLDETKSVAASLVEVSEKVMLLGQARLRLSPAPEVVRTASKQLDKIRTRFANSRKAATLTKGKDWERLLSALPEAASSVRSKLQALWRSHVDNLFTGETPARDTPNSPRRKRTIRRCYVTASYFPN